MKNTKAIKAQSLRRGHVIVFGNGQKRELLTPIKGDRPRQVTSGGKVIALEMYYRVPGIKPLPGVYHPRTGVWYESFEVARLAGEKVIVPEFWYKYKNPPIRKIQFAWDQIVRVVA